MQAIVTKFVCPTDKNPNPMISARAQAGRVVVDWDHTTGPDLNHKQAAVALCKKFGWVGTLVRGALPSGEQVFVFQPNGDAGLTVEVK